MRKPSWIVIVFAILSTMSLAQANCSGKGQIEGEVLDAGSRPVANAKVSILSEECVVIGIEPTGMTDEHGHFLLSGVPVGLDGVYAQKAEAGYPDTTAAIYLDEAALPPKVTVHAGQTSQAVVRLGARSALVVGEVCDEETQQPVATARIRMSMPDNERIMISIGTDRSGRFQLLVPGRPVRLTVNAPGYDTWQFIGNDAPPGIVHLDPDARKDLSIKLRRQKN